MTLAHIAGIPVEETALSFGPIATVVGGLALMRVKAGVRRGKSSIKRSSSGGRGKVTS